MAYNHGDVIRAQAEQLEAERAAAVARYEEGRVDEDADIVMAAANRIIEIDARRAALERIADNFVVQQQSPQGSRYGLNRTEQEIAHNSFSDPNMTLDQKEALYAQNRQKLRHMRATGQYRDDQGTVRR